MSRVKFVYMFFISRGLVARRDNHAMCAAARCYAHARVIGFAASKFMCHPPSFMSHHGDLRLDAVMRKQKNRNHHCRNHNQLRL